jgi:glycosyltransferase involved in cell wall biosynthesis
MIAAADPRDGVEVLMATHNGSRHVAAQLASVLGQTYRPLTIRVRDDASTDDTVAIVRAAGADAPVDVVEGARVGAAANFMALLASSAPAARWIAFCDQDDVWLPDKIARAVAALAPLDDRPALYGSSMIHVNEGLRPLAGVPAPREVGFRNALVQNVLPGCTMVLNRAARALCLDRPPRRAPMHDWWLYLVVAAFGTVVYDGEVTVLHRVHARNATLTRLWRHWPRRVAAHVALPPDRRRSAMIAEFLALFGDRLTAADRTTAEELLAAQRASWLARLRYACQPAVFRQTAIDDVILRVLLTLGRF